jgi:hypothetical protein
VGCACCLRSSPATHLSALPCLSIYSTPRPLVCMFRTDDGRGGAGLPYHGGGAGVGGGGGGIVPPSFDINEFMREYQQSLLDLTFNSKPIISSLTYIAEENRVAADHVVAAIEGRIRSVCHMATSTTKNNKPFNSASILISSCSVLLGRACV